MPLTLRRTTREDQQRMLLVDTEGEWSPNGRGTDILNMLRSRQPPAATTLEQLSHPPPPPPSQPPPPPPPPQPQPQPQPGLHFTSEEAHCRLPGVTGFVQEVEMSDACEMPPSGGTCSSSWNAMASRGNHHSNSRGEIASWRSTFRSSSSNSSSGGNKNRRRGSSSVSGSSGRVSGVGGGAGREGGLRTTRRWRSAAPLPQLADDAALSVGSASSSDEGVCASRSESHPLLSSLFFLFLSSPSLFQSSLSLSAPLFLSHSPLFSLPLSTFSLCLSLCQSLSAFSSLFPHIIFALCHLLCHFPLFCSCFSISVLPPPKM